MAFEHLSFTGLASSEPEQYARRLKRALPRDTHVCLLILDRLSWIDPETVDCFKFIMMLQLVTNLAYTNEASYRGSTFV